jgi:hypothetical protein
MHLRYEKKREDIHSRTGLLPIFSIETKIKNPIWERNGSEIVMAAERANTGYLQYS